MTYAVSTNISKEKREKRIFTLVQLLLSLAAVIAVTYLLKDNPTILLSRTRTGDDDGRLGKTS